MDPFSYIDERRAFLLFKNLRLQTPTSPLVYHVRATEVLKKETEKEKKIIKQPPKKRAQ